MTWRGDVMISVGGEVALEIGKRGENVGWADANLSRPKKIKKIYAINSAATNKLTVKI
jgi:hypothetical protein